MLKNPSKTAQIIRLYGISLAIIWYIIGLSIKIDIADRWEECVYALSLIEPAVEYFVTCITFTLILSYAFEYIINFDFNIK